MDTAAEQQAPARILDGLRAIGDLVHATQRERGASALFLASNGATFEEQYRSFQADSDVQLNKALAVSESVPAAVVRNTTEFRAAEQMVARLDTIRGRIDRREIVAKEAIEYLTDLNESLLILGGVLVEQVVHVETRSRMVSLLALMRAKELAGVERAVLAQVFAEDRFAQSSMLWTVSLVTAQELLLRIAEHTSDESSRNELAQMEQHPAVVKTADLETAVLTNGVGSFGVDPRVWFDDITTRVDLLKGIEDNQMDSLASVISEIGSEHNTRDASVGQALSATILAMRNLRGMVDQVRKGQSSLREFVGRRGEDLAAAEQRLATALETEELAVLARRDDLTGLPNRTAVEGLIDAAIDRTMPGQPRVAVMMLDLDHFKVINDSLGHYAGDELLRAVSDRLRRTVRSCDTIARVGGDEFVIVSEPFESLERTMMVAERILEYVSAPYQIQGRDLRVTVSIGIAVANESHTTATLLRDADLASYRAKSAGRGQISVYDDEMRDELTSLQEAEKRLRAGLDDNQIVAWFQPIIDIETGHPVATEALARWDTGTEVISAGEFIPAAQEVGLLPEIDEAVLQSVLRSRPLLGDRPPAISLNVSDLQLRQPEFAQKLLEQVASHGVNPQDVWIEITEHLPLSAEVAAKNLHHLRQLGFTIVLDDFGSGFSALSVLQSLPIDVLKLDGMFIQSLESDPRTRVVVESIVRIAGTLGMRTVAECVENEAQLNILRELGCDMAQGFFIARPSAAADTTKALRHPLDLGERQVVAHAGE